MHTYQIIILLSSLVIFSYLFDFLSLKTRIPSILLLLITGNVLYSASTLMGIAEIDLGPLLPILGTLGLVLIVFDGALTLRFAPGKEKLILHAFLSALVILLITMFGVAFLFRAITHGPFVSCLLNAIPFSVISSAIAIPSVASLTAHKREFIVYESTFSDIIGIMVFNFLLANQSINWSALALFGGQTLLVLTLSLLCGVVFILIMKQSTQHVKFFLIIASLILVYAVGKEFHLSTLLVVLVFGVCLENLEGLVHVLSRLPWLGAQAGQLLYHSLTQDLKGLKQLTAESAFLLRTFFFLAFGYSLRLNQFLNSKVVLIGMGILFCIYLIRWFYLRSIARAHLFPELLITPRGLISVLLFLSIPTEQLLIDSGQAVLTLVIVVSAVIMAIGLVWHKGDRTQ